METPTPAASAPPAATPDTVSASIDAVNRNDFEAFDRAELGKRTGAPIADVAVAPADAKPGEAAVPAIAQPPATPERPVSRRQQDVNDKIREAVERATAEDKAEIARLRSLAPPAARTPPAARPTDPPPPVAAAATWQEAIRRPDVQQPMLTEEAFFQQFPEAPYAAYGRYWTGYDQVKDQATAHARAAAEEDGRFVFERAASLAEQLTAAKAADPDFMTKIPPALLHASAVPLSALAPGTKATFTNVVAEAALHAAHPIALLTHLQAHPDDATRIAGLRPSQWLFALAQLDGRLAGPATTPTDSTAPPAAPAAAEAARSPITAAPPPPPTLRAAGATSDPKAAALARGDFAEFDRLDVQERMATLSPR